jgi:CHAT domain
MSTKAPLEGRFHLRQKPRPMATASEAAARPRSGRLPRVTQVLALAIHLEDMLRRGEAKDYADLARLSCLCRERVSQIVRHGLTDTWDPEQSFIALADRLLTADFLYTFDAGLLTRMVMLSCCQTAIGYAHPDSILGLANAFLVAGACTVGSTLWNVDDDATATLMSSFYRGIKEGVDASAAMSAAQQQLRSMAPWSHPVYWAPFRISGSFSNPFSGGGTRKMTMPES